MEYSCEGTARSGWLATNLASLSQQQPGAENKELLNFFNNSSGAGGGGENHTNTTGAKSLKKI